MAVSTTDSASVSSNATSDWVRLSPGPNRVLISSGTWNGTTSAALIYSDNATTSYVLRDGLLGSSTAISTTANHCVTVDGPGYVAITVTSYGSNAVTIKAIPCIG